MSNPAYLRGVRLERYFVNLGKEHGWDTARNAGSHGVWDVTWTRETSKQLGSVFEGLEQIHNEGWVPEPSAANVPAFFTYGYFKFTKGIDKKYIWVEPVDGSLRQVIFIQCKTQQGKRNKKRNKK